MFVLRACINESLKVDYDLILMWAVYSLFYSVLCTFFLKTWHLVKKSQCVCYFFLQKAYGVMHMWPATEGPLDSFPPFQRDSMFKVLL
jgi:hypothetical protein